jgi:hypothetical protein
VSAPEEASASAQCSNALEGALELPVAVPGSGAVLSVLGTDAPFLAGSTGTAR